MLNFGPKTWLVSKVLMLGLLASISSKTAIADDIDAGREIYNRGCVSCHGSTGQGNDALGGPALAGQQQAYLARQLEHFANGIRGSDKSDIYGQQMAAMVTLVKDPDSQQNVSSYLASLTKPNSSITQGNTNRGNSPGYKIYQASCGACHGSDAAGNERLNSPSLIGLNKAYLLRQYTNFLEGKRGSHKSDKFGRQMKMMAATVTDPEKIESVVSYILSLQE